MKTNFKYRFLNLLFFVLIRSASAYADQPACTNANFSVSASSVFLNINSCSMLQVTASMRVHTNPCTFFFTFDYGGAGSWLSRSLLNGTNSWPYQIFQDPGQTNILKDLPAASSTTDVLSGSISTLGNQILTLNFFVCLNPTNPYLRFGSYSNAFNVSMYTGSLATHTNVHSKNISLVYLAPRQIDLSLVSTSAPFSLSSTNLNMNFGEIQPSGGSSLSADLLIKYNAGYKILMSSQNNGKLAHSSANDTIAYTIFLSGSAVDLSNSSGAPITASYGAGVSPSTGARFPIQVSLGAAPNKSAGDYLDTITIIVQSAE